MPSILKQNHFELFSLPPQYALDRAELDMRYRDLQRTVHPDRFASASDQERRLSMQQATRINEAYQVLKDPMQRGRYLLELRGNEAGEGPASTQDPAFLMQQMELRENLAEVRKQSDPMASLDRLSREIGRQYRELESELALSLDGDAKDSEKAHDLVLKMQFFTRLQNELQEIEADLEDEIY